MSFAKQLLLAMVGAVLLVLAVLGWWQLTGWIASGIESALCWSAVGEDCRLRGSYSFLIWSTVGVVALVLIGLLLDRLRYRWRLPK